METIVKLRDEQTKLLNGIIEKNGHNTEYYIGMALDLYLEEINEIFEANEIYSQIEQGNEKVWDIESVKKELAI